VNITADVNAIVGEPSNRRALRNGGFDALRATMVLLVLFHHSAITYGAIGGWFYREIKTDDSFSSVVLILFCTVNQAYFMGLFFLLAATSHRDPSATRNPCSFCAIDCCGWEFHCWYLVGSWGR
jgi:peptidoglycan/LPS O-acetylase OafA/YrhL